MFKHRNQPWAYKLVKVFLLPCPLHQYEPCLILAPSGACHSPVAVLSKQLCSRTLFTCRTTQTKQLVSLGFETSCGSGTSTLMGHRVPTHLSGTIRTPMVRGEKILMTPAGSSNSADHSCTTLCWHLSSLHSAMRNSSVKGMLTGSKGARIKPQPSHQFITPEA